MGLVNIETPDADKLVSYVLSRGDAGKQTVKLLKNNLHFLDALNTPVGLDVLKDLCTMHETLIPICLSPDATERNKIKLQIIIELINRWAERIDTYYKALEKINKSRP